MYKRTWSGSELTRCPTSCELSGRTFEHLLDCFITNRVDEIDVGLFLSKHKRLNTIIKVIGLLKENRMRDFYEFKVLLSRQATMLNKAEYDFVLLRQCNSKP